MRRDACVLIFLLLSNALFAASAPYGGQVVVAYLDKPESLNPLNAAFGAAVTIGWAFTNGLVALGAEGQDIPDLAERWEVSPDGLTWTFSLRSSVKFSDGSELTAEDVLANFNAMLDPSSQSSSTLLTQLVKSFQADGKLKFKVNLKSPYSLLTNLVQRAIVPARAITGSAAQKAQYEKLPIGTGPFKITEWTEDRVVLDANLSYFGGRPHLDRIIFKRFTDQKLAWASLMQGTADIVYDVDNEDYSVIKDDRRFKTYQTLDGMCFPILFNLKDPLLGQAPIRQAIALAVDKQDLVEKALLGGGVPTSGPFMPGTWAYNADPGIQPFDPAKSAKILKDLGWKDSNGDWILEKDGKDLEFTVLIDDNDPLKVATTRRLQWQLLQAGIRMKVEVLPLAEFVQERLLPGKFQAAIVQENTYDNPDTMASTLWDSSAIGAFNLGSYSNPEVDRLIALGRATVDQKKKAGIYQQIHKLISNDVPAVFLYFKKRYTATSARLGSFTAGQSGQFGASIGSWFVEKTK